MLIGPLGDLGVFRVMTGPSHARSAKGAKACKGKNRDSGAMLIGHLGALGVTQSSGTTVPPLVPHSRTSPWVGPSRRSPVDMQGRDVVDLGALRHGSRGHGSVDGTDSAGQHG